SHSQAANTVIDAAAAAVMIAAVRFHRLLVALAAGRLGSSHSTLSISCIKGRRSGSLSSARVMMLSTVGGTGRCRCIGVGCSVRCFERTASRVGAWNGGPAQDTAYAV